ncbi:Pilin (type 1 fimbria component protein) [Pseudomonas segetis]|uniref:Pilin (Type 1 fimbria component protein) n=2 Tax=Pseudomonas segetis TaxID=298908 RepID=A0A239AN43_9PSED|nr:Pilin (type 1 fimbria component protein) [Pseudomonas segetis]
MSRNLLFLTICLVVSLILIPVKPAMAGTTNNCSSAQLPWNGVLDSAAAENLPIGSVVPGSDAMTVVTINCTSAWDDNQAYCAGNSGWTVNPVGGATPMETTIPGVYTYAGMPSGIGYQFLDGSGQSLPLDSTNRHDTGVPIQTGDQTIPLHFRMVKTSNALSSGSLNIQMYLSCNGSEWSNRTAAGSILNLTVNAEVITETCSLVTPDVQVQLPEVARSDFKGGVGSTAGSTPFTLDFECGSYVDARFNISDMADLSNTSDTLKLVSGSTASNVGVRLLHQDSPVYLAPNEVFDQGGSLFPLLNPQADTSVISLPFTAEYVQTGAPVRSGSVQSQAVVTISYN